jgi:hypothetical protein
LDDASSSKPRLFLLLLLWPFVAFVHSVRDIKEPKKTNVSAIPVSGPLCFTFSRSLKGMKSLSLSLSLSVHHILYYCFLYSGLLFLISGNYMLRICHFSGYISCVALFSHLLEKVKEDEYQSAHHSSGNESSFEP